MSAELQPLETGRALARPRASVARGVQPVASWRPHTRAEPSLKIPFGTRSEALLRGDLIELASLGVEPPACSGLRLELHWAISRELLHRITDATAPSARASTHSASARLEQLILRAHRALERCVLPHDAELLRSLLHGFRIDLAAPIATLQQETGFVRMHAGPDGDGEFAVLLLLLEEWEAAVSDLEA